MKRTTPVMQITELLAMCLYVDTAMNNKPWRELSAEDRNTYRNMAINVPSQWRADGYFREQELVKQDDKP